MPSVWSSELKRKGTPWPGWLSSSWPLVASPRRRNPEAQHAPPVVAHDPVAGMAERGVNAVVREALPRAGERLPGFHVPKADLRAVAADHKAVAARVPGHDATQARLGEALEPLSRFQIPDRNFVAIGDCQTGQMGMVGEGEGRTRPRR